MKTPKNYFTTNTSNQQTQAVNHDKETRVDQYLAHLQQDRHALPTRVRHLVTDSDYTKKVH